MKKALPAAFASVLLLALAGCSSAGTPSEEGGVIELDFWHGYTEADGEVLNDLVAEFNKSQDEVKITPSVKPWATLLDSALPALTAKKGPQLMAIPPENIPVFASKGALQPLDDWYESDSAADVLNPGAVDTGMVDGERFGAPLSFTPLTMFYNTAMFEAAGVSCRRRGTSGSARRPRSPSTRTAMASPSSTDSPCRTTRPWATASGRLCSRAAAATS
jgi:multiple sugar transport system substrate-binding protein